MLDAIFYFISGFADYITDKIFYRTGLTILKKINKKKYSENSFSKTTIGHIKLLGSLFYLILLIIIICLFK